MIDSSGESASEGDSQWGGIRAYCCEIRTAYFKANQKESWICLICLITFNCTSPSHHLLLFIKQPKFPLPDMFLGLFLQRSFQATSASTTSITEPTRSQKNEITMVTRMRPAVGAGALESSNEKRSWRGFRDFEHKHIKSLLETIWPTGSPSQSIPNKRGPILELGYLRSYAFQRALLSCSHSNAPDIVVLAHEHQ